MEVETEKKKDCVFCKIVKNRETEIIAETENFVAFPDANPKIEGHTLIIPKKHYTNLLDLPANLGSELMGIVKEVYDKKKPEGFNLAMNNGREAGQVVKHAHLHFLPRKEGDGFSWGL